MKIDEFGQHIYTEEDLCSLYLENPDRNLGKVIVDRDIILSEILDLENLPNLIPYKILNKSVSEFDDECQSDWFLPKEYENIDIAKHVLELCSNEDELQRAGHELLMYQERGMFPLLTYLKYLVDVMRANNVVWGVGRGSSVASFVLFLLGIHRINSLYYDLSIDEFLK